MHPEHAFDSLGLGAVWLGEILNKREKVNQILNVPDSLKLMGARLRIKNGTDIRTKRLYHSKYSS